MSIATEIQRLQQAKADIKTAIENKGVIIGDGTIDTYATKIGEISGGGDDNSKFAQKIVFESLNVFGRPIVELNLDNVVDLNGLIANSEVNTTVEHLIVNCKKQITSMNDFNNAPSSPKSTTLKRVTLNIDQSKVKAYTNAFMSNYGLEIIDGSPLDFSSIDTTKSYINNNIFTRCESLREVRFVEESIPFTIAFNGCPLLSDETIQNIIDGLADLTGGTTQTLTFHATVGGKLTDTQKASITAKNWTLAY